MKFICYCSAFYLLAALEPYPIWSQDGPAPTHPPEQRLIGSKEQVADATIISGKARFPLSTAQTQGVNPAALARLSELVNGSVEADEIVGA